MSDPVIQSQTEESPSWYSPFVDSAKSYLRPLYDEGVELLEKADRYYEEKKQQASTAYDYVVITPAEKMAADALGYVQHHYPEQAKAVAGLVKKAAPYALPFYRWVTPDPIESFIASQAKEFLKDHEEGAEVLAEALGGEALVQSLNTFIGDEAQEFVQEEAYAVIAPAPIVEAEEVKQSSPKNPAPVQKKVEQEPPSVAVVEDDDFYEEEIPDSDDGEIISAVSEPADSPLAQGAREVLEPSVVSVASNDPELNDTLAETTPQVEPAEEGRLAPVVKNVEIQTVVVSTEEGVVVSSPDLSADVPVVLAAFSADVPTESRQANHPKPQPATPEATEATISAPISDGRIDLGDQADAPADLLEVKESEEKTPPVLHQVHSSPYRSSSLPVADENPLQEIDVAMAREVGGGNAQSPAIPSFRPGAQAGASRDLQADDGETKTVANNLDAPLNDIPGSADKGFDSDRQGKDNSKELMFALADAVVDGASEEIDSTLEDAILPSSLRADVFLTT